MSKSKPAEAAVIEPEADLDVAPEGEAVNTEAVSAGLAELAAEPRMELDENGTPILPPHGPDADLSPDQVAAALSLQAAPADTREGHQTLYQGFEAVARPVRVRLDGPKDGANGNPNVPKGSWWVEAGLVGKTVNALALTTYLPANTKASVLYYYDGDGSATLKWLDNRGEAKFPALAVVGQVVP